MVQDPESFLNRFINLEQRSQIPYPLKLERMAHLLDLLGSPEKSGMKFLIVAGSKGKGSTAAMLGAVLRAAGFKTGLYTSPHLLSWRERIGVNGQPIGEEEAGEIIPRLRDVVEKGPFPHGLPTYFEMLTAMALIHFFREKCRVGVLEVGLGGEFDATNACPSDVSVITPIGYEHEALLGPTLREIASAKCGVIKPGGAAVAAIQCPEVLGVVRERARRAGASLLLVQEDVQIRELEIREDSQRFEIAGPWGTEGPFEIRLRGMHQIENAATAYLALRRFFERENVRVSSEALAEGLRHVAWPGRVEKISDRPLIVIDGAHTPESAAALSSSLERHFRFDRLHMVLGMMEDKNPEAFLEPFRRRTDCVWVCGIQNERSFKSEELARRAASARFSCRVFSGLSGAWDALKPEVRGRDLVLITGSLYLAAEAKRAFDYAVF